MKKKIFMILAVVLVSLAFCGLIAGCDLGNGDNNSNDNNNKPNGGNNNVEIAQFSEKYKNADCVYYIAESEMQVCKLIVDGNVLYYNMKINNGDSMQTYVDAYVKVLGKNSVIIGRGYDGLTWETETLAGFDAISKTLLAYGVVYPNMALKEISNIYDFVKPAFISATSIIETQFTKNGDIYEGNKGSMYENTSAKLENDKITINVEVYGQMSSKTIYGIGKKDEIPEALRKA